MLGVASALVGHQIRTDVERELRRVGASARKLGVHVELFTVGIIPVLKGGLIFLTVGKIAMCINRNATFFSQGVSPKLQKAVGDA